jgi:lipoyl(octanoyl) transferase
MLESRHATFVRTNRGGDITYHGPGQVVGYPIFNLDSFGVGIREYIHRLEEAIIHSLAEFGIAGERLEGATGVWIEPQVKGRARKICAIGVRASHWVTMHGFALNVSTDLSYFHLIHPCGFTDKEVTSMERETGNPVESEKVKMVLRRKIGEVFEVKS